MDLPQPYIGITGIVDEQDVATIAACVQVLHARHPHRRLMAGVLVSRKTLTHDVTTNRRYPVIEVVNDLLDAICQAGAWPVIHYNTRSNGNSLASELDILTGVCPMMQGIQLNVVTPDPAVVREFSMKCPGIKVILQINGSSLRATGLTPHAYALGHPGIKHALLDFSGGTGRVFSSTVSDTIMETYYPLTEQGVRLGLAGGMGPGCKERLVDLGVHLMGHGGDPDILLRDLSFDAESGVRIPVPDPIEGEHYQDRLDHDKAVAYVEAVCQVI